jgi:hypothetical protein
MFRNIIFINILLIINIIVYDLSKQTFTNNDISVFLFESFKHFRHISKDLIRYSN